MKYRILLSLIVPLFAACDTTKEQAKNEADTALNVSVHTLAGQQLSNEISLSGTVEGKTTVKLGFMVPGKVEFISSKEGEPVSKGQLLARLEPTNYSLAKQLADVQLNSVTDEYKRLELMHKKGSVSESDFSKISSSLQQAGLQQKLETKNLADTRLYSPLTGVLLSKQTEVGEVIAAGTPLFIVADIQKIIVSAYIPEGELHQVNIGQPAEISISALKKTFNGTVTEVGAVADATSRAFMIKIEVENTGLQIRPGMIAEARMKGTGSSQGITVPAECVIRDLDNQSYVYVVDKEQHKAFKRKVSLGRMMDNKIQVMNGLAAGETIITSGQSKLSDGATITVVK
ncbi:efflux RND transporter periplasmic adaptor subunit [Chitinophaga tropicalis]|uniref:Efflux RND transporter periplasmic adaptor subunit n=1 Tax=Chitinophaga tropicalis TaxID=2683588 RepID=A0A7K1U2Y7_9BACT|nr:efflux RND transporter periplasmic adaptor subunit [Chitinophaga tropicalis]MVT08719.1 efflux RND transporter periplasmic adaptor subunit [Chitinophaga tropicalis]